MKPNRTIPDNVTAAIQNTASILNLRLDGPPFYHKDHGGVYRQGAIKSTFVGTVEVYLNSNAQVTTVNVSMNWEHP